MNKTTLILVSIVVLVGAITSSNSENISNKHDFQARIYDYLYHTEDSLFTVEVLLCNNGMIDEAILSAEIIENTSYIEFKEKTSTTIIVKPGEKKHLSLSKKISPTWTRRVPVTYFL